MRDQLPNLGFVVSQGAGSDKIDIAGLEKRGVRVRCVGEALTDDVADLAMTLTIMLCRDLVAPMLLHAAATGKAVDLMSATARLA